MLHPHPPTHTYTHTHTHTPRVANKCVLLRIADALLTVCSQFKHAAVHTNSRLKLQLYLVCDLPVPCVMGARLFVAKTAHAHRSLLLYVMVYMGVPRVRFGRRHWAILNENGRRSWFSILCRTNCDGARTSVRVAYLSASLSLSTALCVCVCVCVPLCG